MADSATPENEREVLRFLDSIDSEGSSAKELSAKHWEESLRQYRGDQWRLQRSPHFLANIIRNQVQRKVDALTEVKPTIKVVPMKPNLKEASTVVQQCVKAIWDMQQMDQTIHRLCTMAMTVGSGFLYTTWDPTADNKNGDIKISYVDPRRVVVDPGVTDAADLRNAAYTVVESFDTLANIRQLYPGRGLLVKPDRKYSSLMTPKNRPGGIMSAVLRAMPTVFRPGPSVKEGPIPRAAIREYFIADPQLGQDGMPLYPTGRHIVRAGDVILIDENNPYWDGMNPLDMMDWNTDFDSPWGMGEVQDLRRIQEAFNRIGDGIIRNALLTNNVKVIADMDALEPDKWKELTNEGGIVIKKRPGRELTYEMPKEMPQYLFQLMSQLTSFADLLTGNVDLMAQRASGSNSPTSASAIEGLQAQSQVLIRGVARRLEGLLERMGQKLISRIFQFYTHDRTLQLLGPSNEWMGYVFERQKLFMDDEGNLRSPIVQQSLFRDFRFLVVPGSALSSTRIQRTMMMLNLRGSLQGVPVPPIEDILKEADIGDPEDLMRRGFEEQNRLGIQPPEPKGKKK